MSKLFLCLLLGLFCGSKVAYSQGIVQADSPMGGWTIVNSGTSAFLATISFPTRDTIWVGGLLRSVNGGVEWKTVSIPTSESAALFPTSNDGVLICNGDLLYRTTNAGETWIPLHSTMPYTRNAAVLSPSHLFIVGLSWIGRSTDSGNTWKVQEVSAPTHNAIAFSNPERGVAVGARVGGPLPSQEGGACFVTSDSGKSWTKTFSGATGDLWCVAASASLDFYAGGDDGIHASRDGGQTWYLQNPVGGTINALAFPSRYHGIAIGNGGLIMVTTDSGHSWTRQPSGTQAGLYAVSFFDDSLGIITGVNGTILRTTNGGTAWVKDPQPLALDLSLYPNPARRSIQVSYTLPTPQHVVLDVYSSSGQKQPGLTISGLQFGEQHLTIPTASLESGAYYLQLTSESYQQHASFTIAR